MTEDEARKKLEIELKTPTEVFCPLISSQCRKDCVCYLTPRLVNSYIPRGRTNDRAYISTQQKKGNPLIATSWYVTASRCDNAMFFGNDS